jgi:nucleoside-diphosphate-sugar epimerase
MRVFVTGATGVVGTRLVPLLLKAGHQVTAVGRSPDRLSALERSGASTAVIDLFDRELLRVRMSNHDAAINVATHVPGTGLSAFMPGAWKAMDRIRREASALLADVARENGVRIFVQESFAPTYPDSGDRWITEEVPPAPAPYNRTALDAEKSAARFAQRGGTGVALRFAFFYGNHDQFTKDVVRYVRRGWLPILGRPDGYFPMVNHDDAASAVVASLSAPSGVYNVVDNEPLTRGEIGKTLAGILHVSPPRIPPPWTARLAGGLGETLARSLRISNNKLRNATGWSPTYPSVREGFLAALQSEAG